MKKILTSKSFIKLAILIALQALYAGVSLFIALAVGLLTAELIGIEAIAMLLTAIVYFGIPILLGFLLVDRVKWWLISLPVQFLLGLGFQFTFLNPFSLVFDGSIGELLEMITYALIPLIAQAVGVGIKLLWLKRKAKNAPKT